MDMDDDACYRALATRDARFDGRLFVGGEDHRHLLPADLPGAHAEARERALLPVAPRRRRRPASAPACAAGRRPRPTSRAWRGTSNTVARALRLIEAGALDEGDVDGLADRLGVGERQLRRLFRQHLGASPIAVAQTRRVLLAKQLIHETRLPMAEVALASGFGSVRRFNETFQQLYDRPPAALRRASRRTARAARPSGRLTLQPALPAALRLGRDARLPGLRAIPGVERVERRRYAAHPRDRRRIGADRRRARRRATGCASTVRFPKLSALPAIIARVRRVFDLAADPAAIGEHLAQDPALAPLVAARPGLRVPGAWDGFELAIRAILGQQITVVAAPRPRRPSWSRAYGEPLPADLAGAVGPDPRLPDAAAAGRRRLRRARHAAVAGRGARRRWPRRSPPIRRSSAPRAAWRTRSRG